MGPYRDARAPSSQPSEEGEVKAYLDGLVATLMAQKAATEHNAGTAEDSPKAPQRRGEGECAPPSSVPRGRRKERASMREGLLELFRDTASSLPPDPFLAIPTSRMQVTSGQIVGPSQYFARYLAQKGHPVDVVSTGLDELDRHLGGGFHPGLHLIAGRRGAGKTAFLESVAWEAFSTKRPVIYYSLRDGSQAVWMRLIGVLGALLEGPRVPASTLASRDLDSRELAAVRSLDGELQGLVLPLLSLVDEPPLTADPWTALLEDLVRRARRAEQLHGKVPLAIVDDLDQLLLLTGPRPLAAMLSHLDRTLVGASVPGLLSLARSGGSLPGVAALPARSTLVLSPSTLLGRQRAGSALRQVDLSLEFAARRRLVRLPLVMDLRTGFFALQPEREVRETHLARLARDG
jgi:hypothetical protein